MVTEVIKATGRFRGKTGRISHKRFVEITGKDLSKFAEVLRKQAAEASAAGEHHKALRLQNLARKVEHARKFTMEVPLGTKLSG